MLIASSYGSTLYDPGEIQKTRAALKMRGPNDTGLAADAREASESMMIQGSPDADLSSAERRVLAQENALKAAAGGAATSTTYRYEIGPDGKKYIVGAEISFTGTEEELNAIPGGREQPRPAGGRTDQADGTDSDKAEGSAEDSEKKTNPEEDPQVRAAISELRSVEREVVAHEAAHMAVGGQFAGGVSYSYTTGPDGKKYITGGEVPISMPATDDPEEALQNAEQVRAAALAPAKPSGPDMAVAANASQVAAQARAELAAARGEEASGENDASKSATGSAETVAAENESPLPSDGGKPNAIDAYTVRRIRDAYAATASKNGLWIAANKDDDRFITTSTDAEAA